MKRNYSEYICDYCGNAMHVMCGYRWQIPADEQMKKNYGWIIKGKKHFCCEECYEKYKKGMNYDDERKTNLGIS